MEHPLYGVYQIFIVLTSGVLGLGALLYLYQHYKKKQQDVTERLDLIGEIEAELKSAEINLLKRLAIFILQITVFTAIPALFLFRTAFLWVAHHPSTGIWLAISVIYISVVVFGGFGVWYALALARSSKYKGFNSHTKYPDGTNKHHHWFTGDPYICRRGIVTISEIENPTISAALTNLDQTIGDSTVFRSKQSKQDLYLTLYPALQYDADIVLVLTRHPEEKAWHRREGRLYSYNLPLCTQYAAPKFRYLGNTTVVIEKDDGTLKIKAVPMLWAPVNDQDDADFFYDLDEDTQDVEGEEILAAQIAFVHPSAPKLRDKYARDKANWGREKEVAKRREKNLLKSVGSMVSEAIKKEKKEIRKTKRKIPWFWVLLIGMLLFVAGLVVSQLFWHPFGSTQQITTTVTEEIEERLLCRMIN